MPKRIYNLKIKINEEGYLSAAYSENGKSDEDIDLPAEQNRLKFKPEYETINVIVNILRDNRLKGDEEYEMLGRYLYNALLNNDMGKRIHVWLNDNNVEYIKIELNFAGNDNKFAGWPWEYMYCEAGKHGNNTGYFIATRPKIIMTRPVNKPLEEMTEPLRILLVAPGPPSSLIGNAEKVKQTFGLNLLAYENLFETIKDICTPYPNIIELTPFVAKESENSLGERCYTLTIDDFGKTVNSIKPHVIHFYGHGRVTGSKGQLAFTNAFGQKDWIDEDVFANKVKISENIKFVFLQACESAALTPHKAISGVARQLVSLSVPAVIAMQCRINQDSALRFTKSFYEELSNTGIIDAAVQKGRMCISEAKNKLVDSDEEERDFAFGIPVLYIKDRVRLFKKELEHKKEDGSNVYEIFKCWECEKEHPMKTKFCPEKGVEMVDRPNPSCPIPGCPRKLCKYYKFCPMCQEINKEYAPK